MRKIKGRDRNPDAALFIYDCDVLYWITNMSSPIGALIFTSFTLYSAKYAPAGISNRCEKFTGTRTPSTSLYLEIEEPKVIPLYGMMNSLTRAVAGSM